MAKECFLHRGRGRAPEYTLLSGEKLAARIHLSLSQATHVPHFWTSFFPFVFSKIQIFERLIALSVD